MGGFGASEKGVYFAGEGGGREEVERGVGSLAWLGITTFSLVS